MRFVVCLFALAGMLLLPARRSACDNMLIAGSELRNHNLVHSVWQLDIGQLSLSRFWTTEDREWTVNSICMLPHGGWVGVGTHRVGSVEARIDIVDSAGSIRARIGDVHPSFVSSPDGRRLAFLSSENANAHTAWVTGLWVRDLDTKAEEKLSTEKVKLEMSAKLAWPSFDSRLYVAATEAGPVYVVDPNGKRLVPVTHKSLDFSPEGKYYHLSLDAAQRCRIFLREGDEEVTDRYPFLVTSPQSPPYGFPRGWFSNRHLVLPEAPTARYIDFILDCDSATVYEVPGIVLTLVDNHETVIFYRHEGRVEKQPMSSLKVVTPSGKSG